MIRTASLVIVLGFFATFSSAAFAQLAPDAPMPPAPASYGTPLTLAEARKVLAAAEAEATANKWNVVIAIVDTGGHLVTLARLDDTQFGSLEIAQGKAYTSVALRRPTKALQDVLAAGGEGMRILGIRHITPLEGGVPIIVEGKIVGGIGVSGVTSQQDAQIAAAGAAALAK